MAVYERSKAVDFGAGAARRSASTAQKKSELTNDVLWTGNRFQVPCQRRLPELRFKSWSGFSFFFSTAKDGEREMTLASYTEIYGWPTYYEGDGTTQTFTYETNFYARLETWAAFYYTHTPSDWSTPARIYSLGAYVSTSPPMHSAGRAFDLTRIYFNSATFLAFDARTVPASTVFLDRYWAVAASLHYHFAYVITYPYKSSNGLYEHRNHIHIDNQASGNVNSVFSTSTTQVQFVQHALYHVWGYTVVGLDGVWGPQTADYASRALDRSGAAGALTSQANWQRFCLTTTRFGTGQQSY